MADPEHERTFATERHAVCPKLDGLDLSGLDLSGANLGGAHLKNANLSGCKLSYANLSTNDLRSADLSNADLTSSNLHGAVLVGANLTGAILTKANFVKTRLDNAVLTRAVLDHTDLRGSKGLTKDQLDSAADAENAILDERSLAALGRKGKVNVARHRRKESKRSKATAVDFIFVDTKPHFGDLFRLCGCEHPNFPPTGEFGFSALARLEIEQMDDYFAICRDGNPIVWIFPLVKGRVVDHHPGPFDGIRIELGGQGRDLVWSNCVEQFDRNLAVAFNRIAS
jgi:uncharacterized protein YjbI with pentapeptide repeats